MSYFSLPSGRSILLWIIVVVVVSMLIGAGIGQFVTKVFKPVDTKEVKIESIEEVRFKARKKLSQIISAPGCVATNYDSDKEVVSVSCNGAKEQNYWYPIKDDVPNRK